MGRGRCYLGLDEKGAALGVGTSEAIWIAVNTHPHWKEQCQRLARRRPANKAIVSVARKLLVVVWHVLTECVAGRKADGDGTIGQWV
jgi:hypothetical protein